ncbi:MAG: hypothetical protein LH618_02815 [Saprospiraceae bacterium]|nr:hypothetical protein [Saprospiraceae bacterium]
MGDIPQSFPILKPAPPKIGLPLLIGGILLLICALKWRDVVEYVDGEPILKTKQKNELQRKLEELENVEQYALRAEMDGWYPCLHSGLKTYYLRQNEVWKYGVTSKGELGRYTSKFLNANKVYYSLQFTGTMNECLQEEQRKLFNYPILPENLARLEENRLLRPPFNPILK